MNQLHIYIYPIPVSDTRKLRLLEQYIICPSKLVTPLLSGGAGGQPDTQAVLFITAVLHEKHGLGG